MLFRLTQDVKDLYFQRETDSPLVFVFKGGKSKVSIASKEDEGDGKDVISETTIEQNANTKIQEIFERLSDGYYSDPKIVERTELERKLANREIHGYSLPYDLLPSNFRNYVQDVWNHLQSVATRTVNTLRWSGGINGPPDPFHNASTEWSFDGEEWQPLPGQKSMVFRHMRGISRSENTERLVESTVDEGGAEPLAHELLREAYGLCQSHPRSAFLIGMTAAECGVKQTIVSLQSETEWLVENAPSPNIRSLLDNYFPLLPTKNKLNGQIIFPKETILAPLKKAIHMRNRLAHLGKFEHGSEKTEQILDRINDLLWILDFYRGHCWALQYLSSECAEDLCATADITRTELTRCTFPTGSV